ncbi:MAG: D-alanyl-D-alanine carboxypeptidase, partial [Pseudomonadota bacterium]
MWFRLLTVACALFLLTAQSFADIKKKVAAIAPSGSVLVVDSEGNELVAQNVDKSFSPASVAKIVTAWLAMEVLGGDYRFETSLFIDDDRVLYVRGGGDPFLVSEELAILAENLVEAAGKEPFKKLVVDTSHFPETLRVPGIKEDSESYNAPNSALAANFNTIYARRSGKKVTSAEKQTPITPLAVEQFRSRGPSGRGRISLPQDDLSVGARYAGELIAEFIAKAGGSVEGDVSIGSVPGDLEPVYVHRQSRDLAELVKLMLIGSNNYIANQIFLQIGAHRLGGPVSLEKSLQIAGGLFIEHDLVKDIKLEEGSGI